jgi:phosphoenolpyruvate carboxykinase (GTP)
LNVPEWVQHISALCKPDKIVWCDGSNQEIAEIKDLLVAEGRVIRLNPEIRPDSFLARTDPRDVARVEDRTFICSTNEEDAGPTNNWMDPDAMKELLASRFASSMRGRTMYVVPFSMGPIGSDLARYGVEITDSPYVVASMHIMTKVSDKILDLIEDGASWVPAVHSVGMPLRLEDGTNIADVTWPCNPDVYVAHFPETREIWSFGSGYGGNSLLGKKAMALRIGSAMGRDEGWLAEHMLLVRITNPEGKRFSLAAAFPSACGKTNLAMLKPNKPGWKVETIGDDILWIAPGKNGELRAINPESGFFGVAPGTSEKTNAVALATINKGTIFTNVGLTTDGDVWWEGLTKTPPAGVIDWTGSPWDAESGKPVAHPNSRFCAPIENCPSVPEDWNDPQGHKLDAIIFGGRRATQVPLVIESKNFDHGIFLGVAMASEQTAAAEGPVGVLRRDPFAMLPFCGYNMGDYWAHWLDIGSKLNSQEAPKIFQVNWFRKDQEGKFLWPGFAENLRVISWITRVLEGKQVGQPHILGTSPATDEFDLDGLEMTAQEFEKLFELDSEKHLSELDDLDVYLKSFGEHLPEALTQQLALAKQAAD